jgi:hypothetical protein
LTFPQLQLRKKTRNLYVINYTLQNRKGAITIVTVSYSFTSGTTISSSQVNSNFTQVAGAIKPTFVFTVAGTLSTGTSVTPALISNGSWTITKAYAYIKTVNTGAAIIIDINKNGTSLWSATPANRLTISASDADHYATQTNFDNASIAEGDILTLDLDQVGSTISGSDLTVQLMVV